MSFDDKTRQMERIARMSDSTAYCILTELCKENGVLRQRTVALADKFDAFNSTRALNEGSQAVQRAQTTNSAKRKADDDCMVCSDCACVLRKTRIVVTPSAATTAVFIPDMDGSVWDEHDHYLGEIDTDEWKRECLKGFKWNCRNAMHDSPGCQTRNHHHSSRHTRQSCQACASQSTAKATPIEINSDKEGDDGDSDGDGNSDQND
ncbi:hypothetical protein SPBR_04447 [Sporothrix brasiliensis 5110]|uniref:Uncharacterized protein n=1 Tax=Sporothrix brasiliensis 5110 TaxID=1398154 RepID=A0A0C2J2R1_9PEZI|nr:uncharacterized protein SPBR_04447 [Sporothrix brasiliensis 5110]KIH93335.1 hypothetical protein SPBR_04447 [Sporothrix brasiliensis 5110]